MIEGQLRPGGMNDPAILARFAALKREEFVFSETGKALAYADTPAPLGVGPRTLLPPLVLARMVQALEPLKGLNMLVVGAGSGYEALFLAPFCKQVVALEQDKTLAEEATLHAVEEHMENMLVVHGLLAEGYRAEAPYDAVLMAVPYEVLPQALGAQVAEGARVVGVQVPQVGVPQLVVSTRKGRGWDMEIVMETEGVAHTALKEETRFVF
jgi:protein-L-isoaspartate(D-aspartate) O-methyltransferase